MVGPYLVLGNQAVFRYPPVEQGARMGSINFPPRSLPDNLTELAGGKAGLALSIEEICDHLSGTPYPDTVRDSEEHGARLRSEDYEDLYYRLMHRIGYTEQEYFGPVHAMAKQFHRYKNNPEKFGLYEAVSARMTGQLASGRDTTGPIDGDAIFRDILREFGVEGGRIAIETFEIIQMGIRMNPHLGIGREWNSPLELSNLFQRTDHQPERGRFIDQRYIDYLSNNTDRLGDIDWRKFEQLTAEFFGRQGYKVELGPGRNDDGVDVRVWHPGADLADKPLCIAQCKRTKSKIEKVIVKGLHADVQYEQAEYGVIVTTSELSPGAKTTISARGYAIQAVEHEGVKNWLKQLRTPGSGIVR